MKYVLVFWVQNINEKTKQQQARGWVHFKAESLYAFASHYFPYFSTCFISKGLRKSITRKLRLEERLILRI